ncbi:MAG: class I SAM-dependent methyltransferase [Calditrichaeota bacterium]|nr:MAG: class I SAM-dependent methyltransferase [Calditrichota bacterium]
MADKHNEMNRDVWNEIVELHYNHPDYKLKEFLNGWNSLKKIERDALGDVNGKSLLHLMCQFGMDTLSWGRLGANVTGVDISDKSIEFAEKLKKQTGMADAKFVRSDIYDLIGKIDKKFDFIFMSHGTHPWFENLTKWAKTVAHYLKPGGTFFIVDGHPVADLFLWGDEFNYFHKGPYKEANWPDYCDREYKVKGESVEWMHKLSDFVNAMVKAGLTVVELNEYNKGYYDVKGNWVRKGDYWYPPEGPTKYPLMFSMKVRK